MTIWVWRKQVIRWCSVLGFAFSVLCNAGNAASLTTRVDFEVAIDRSLKTGFGIYARRDDIVIHIHQSGQRTADLLIDGHTGQPWVGGIGELFQNFSRIDDYDAQAEATDSYLSRLGCKAYQVCTNLGDASFVLMWRVGNRPNVLQFRLMDFGKLFVQIENVLEGKASLKAGDLDAEGEIALQEAAGHGEWRIRFDDALRRMPTIDAAARLGHGPEHERLRQLEFFTTRDVALNSLEREWFVAGCRIGALDAAKRVLTSAEPNASKSFSEVLTSCNAYFIHVVDALNTLASSERSVLAQRLSSSAVRSDEDVVALLKFVAPTGGSVKSTRPRGNEQAIDDAKSSRLAIAAKRARASGLAAPALPGGGNVGTSEVSTSRDDAIAELLRVQSTAPIKLLAFQENTGVVRADPADAAGSVFLATAVGKLSEGLFRIETFNRPGSPIRFKVGAYAVRIKVILDWTRADQCNGWGCVVTGDSKIKLETRSDSRELEFQLVPGNAFRNVRQVSFGELIPRDWEQTGRYSRSLKDVRLSVTVRDIRPI